jgi:trans-aconitate methyltransferase
VAPKDPWLARWLPLIAERAAGLPVFELGCGGGRDSEVLAEAGHQVVGIDLSGKAIASARGRVPSATFHCRDIRAPFPVERAGVVIASLSLHYFPWPETEALVDRILQLLVPAVPAQFDQRPSFRRVRPSTHRRRLLHGRW